MQGLRPLFLSGAGLLRSKLRQADTGKKQPSFLRLASPQGKPKKTLAPRKLMIDYQQWSFAGYSPCGSVCKQQGNEFIRSQDRIFFFGTPKSILPRTLQPTVPLACGLGRPRGSSLQVDYGGIALINKANHVKSYGQYADNQCVARIHRSYYVCIG